MESNSEDDKNGKMMENNEDDRSRYYRDRSYSPEYRRSYRSDRNRKSSRRDYSPEMNESDSKLTERSKTRSRNKSPESDNRRDRDRRYRDDREDRYRDYEDRRYRDRRYRDRDDYYGRDRDRYYERRDRDRYYRNYSEEGSGDEKEKGRRGGKDSSDNFDSKKAPPKEFRDEKPKDKKETNSGKSTSQLNSDKDSKKRKDSYTSKIEKSKQEESKQSSSVKKMEDTEKLNVKKLTEATPKDSKTQNSNWKQISLENEENQNQADSNNHNKKRENAALLKPVATSSTSNTNNSTTVNSNSTSGITISASSNQASNTSSTASNFNLISNNYHNSNLDNTEMTLTTPGKSRNKNHDRRNSMERKEKDKQRQKLDKDLKKNKKDKHVGININNKLPTLSNTMTSGSSCSVRYLRKLVATTTFIFACFTVFSSRYVQDQIYVRRYGMSVPPNYYNQAPQDPNAYNANQANMQPQAAQPVASAVQPPAPPANPEEKIEQSYINDLVEKKDEAGIANAINVLAEENSEEYEHLPAGESLQQLEQENESQLAAIESALPPANSAASVASVIPAADPASRSELPPAPEVPVAPAAPAVPAAPAAPAAPANPALAAAAYQPGNPHNQPPKIGALEQLLGVAPPSSVGNFHNELADPATLIPVPEKPEVTYNPRFIFHTKLPKAGSTTMNNILKALSVKNMFFYAKINPHMLGAGDSLRAEEPVAKWYNKTMDNTVSVNSRYNGRIVLLKHHYPYDFSKYHIQNPTYINVLREPASWFQSHYYFERFGWMQDSGDRNSFSGSNEDRDRTINQCIEQGIPDCKIPKWTYFEYICGGNCPKSKALRKAGHTDMTKILEMSKQSLLNRFYVVGILEDFDRSLQLFEKMMPEVFTGVLQVAHSYAIQSVQNSTKSLHVTKLTPENAGVLRSGALKYESDLYQFAKAIFYQQVRKYGLIQ